MKIPPAPTRAFSTYDRPWPSYQITLSRTRPKRDGSGPDRSVADYSFCFTAITGGKTIEDTIVKLVEVSQNAQGRAATRAMPGSPSRMPQPPWPGIGGAAGREPVHQNCPSNAIVIKDPYADLLPCFVAVEVNARLVAGSSLSDDCPMFHVPYALRA
jgi:hypothetical protein